jgi:hypothetical protein
VFLICLFTILRISLIWRRHHCRWRFAKFRPMLGAQNYNLYLNYIDTNCSVTINNFNIDCWILHCSKIVKWKKEHLQIMSNLNMLKLLFTVNEFIVLLSCVHLPYTKALVLNKINHLLCLLLTFYRNSPYLLWTWTTRHISVDSQ